MPSKDPKMRQFYAQNAGRARWGERSVKERFWEKIDKDGPTVYEHLGPCWVWTACITKKGYGHFTVKVGDSDTAHRISWRLAWGEIPEDLSILHRCDNPPCVRPDHLFLGTAKDNMQDAARKKRTAIGERNGMAKSSNAKVKQIRELYATGKYSQKDISLMFLIEQASISSIVKGQIWKDAPGPIQEADLRKIYSGGDRRKVILLGE